MGKTKKNKIRAKRDPIGLPGTDNVEDFEQLIGFGGNNSSRGPIEPIIEQLQSVSVEEKMCALQTLSTLCQNNSKISSIVDSNIVRIAAPFLVDRNLSIRQATAGALRNLSVCGIEICEYLVEQDVLTSLLTLLNEYAQLIDWVPLFDRTMNDQLDEKSDVFLQSVNIVWNLCESSSVALDFFNQSQLLQSFVRCLNWDVYGFEIAITVAQCLLVISEDNPSCWRVLSDYGTEFSNLLPLVEENEKFSHTILRTLSAAIMSNVPALSGPCINQIFVALTKTLDINHRTFLSKLTSILPLDGVDGEGFEIEVTDDTMSEGGDESEEVAHKRRRRADLPSELEVEIKNIERLLESQRIAAETLTNLCSPDDEETMNDDEEEMSDAESVHDYDKSNNSSTTNLQNTDRIPVEIQEAIKSLGLVEKLWQRAQPIPENVSEVLKEVQPKILKQTKKMRVAAVLCLHNLCNSLSTEDLGGAEGIYAVWLDLGQQAFQGPQDFDSLEATTALMRAALEHLKGSPQLFSQMTNNDLELILNGVKSCNHSEVSANWLRMLGILGSFLSESLVRVIISFVLDVCSQSEIDAWTLSEALDSLMDIFADNDWNQITYELNLGQKSRELEKVLKNKLRQQKRELGERYLAVCTVRTNLSRFSKYIEGQLKNYIPITNDNDVK